MLASVRRAWAWWAIGVGLAAALGIGYCSLRAQFPEGPSLGEVLLVGVGLAAASTGLAVWTARENRRATLHDLTDRVAALCEHPGTPLRPSPTDELAPLHHQLDALTHLYNQALTGGAAKNDALSDPSAQLGRADAELGRSLFRGLGPGHLLIARLTADFLWNYLTPALEELLGYSLEQLVNRPLIEIVDPDDVAKLIDSLQEALTTGEGHNIVCRIRNARGKECHVQLDVLTRYDGQVKPLLLRCHFIDITQRVRTERELRQRTAELQSTITRMQRINSDLERLKESYRDLYHNAPVMYFSLDVQGRFATCNERVIQTLGYGRKELYGQPYSRLLAPEARARFLFDPATFEQPGEVETKWVKKDGTVIDVWIRSVPLLDANGAFVRSRSAAQDVTERNRLANDLRAKAEELEKANAQLRRKNRELDEFTYVVSHDLKEPLRTMETFSNFLAQDCGPQLGADGQESISYLIQACRRLKALIDDLLTLSRAGRSTHAPHLFDLIDVVETVRGDLAHLIQRKGATVRVQGLLPAVAGDPQRIAQLLANLVGNGLKYNTAPRPEVVIGSAADVQAPDSESEMRLDADVAARPAQPEFVTVFVRDNGIGIEPKYHQQIFRIFKRLHRQDEYEGTGAGLAICKKIIEAHGGRIWVDSQLGQGATFYFTLPRPQQTGDSWSAVLGHQADDALSVPTPGPASGLLLTDHSV
jgi:PAS domain S-box-containing protein